ncbi:E3 ubiquitin-protein ligase makorin-2-like [Penaeus indicus]|uniref:E3 ubiquitin-protein ligase makorin-2-like n=1 Tax=Penaeus indicus TaxID=29960 RepID=UPI00300D8D80
MFQCDRCNNMFDKKKRQPIVLSGCGHTYCRICIREERSQDRFMCPKCSIISRDLEDMPINRTLYQLLDAEGRGEGQGPVPAGSRDSFAVGLPAEEEKERKAMLEQLRRIKGGESGGEEVPVAAVGGEGLSLKNLSLSDDEGGACGFSVDFHMDGGKEWTRKKLEEEEETDEEEQRRLMKRMNKLLRKEQEQLELAIALSKSLQEAQPIEKES